MEKKGLYTHFSACCGARQGRIYSLVLEGGGEMPLGVPEWQDGCFVLQRTLANHAWSGIGTVQRVSLYVRSAAESGDAAPEEAAEEGWILLRHPEYFFFAHSRRSCPACRTAIGNRKAAVAPWRCPLTTGVRFCCRVISVCPY